MIQNADQRRKVPILQVLKVGLRHQRAGKVVFPLHAQQRRFQRTKIALLQPQLPQTAGRKQYVRMTGGEAVVPDAVHEKARFEQRHVEGFPVEGAEDRKTFHPGGQQVQHDFFVRVVAHEKLLYRKPGLGKITKPHLKGYRAHAAGKPGGFRIQKEHVLRDNGSGKIAAEHGAQRFRRGIASVAEGGQREHGLPAIQARFRRFLVLGSRSLGRGRVHHSQLVQKSCHCANSSFRINCAFCFPSVPTSAAGPTQAGQPSAHPHSCTTDSACSSKSCCMA